MAFSPITSWQIYWETVTDFIFGSSKITLDGDCSQEIKRSLPLGRKAMTNPDSILKSRDITLPTKVHLEPKNWCFWTVVLEKTLENPLDRKEIQPVHPKGNQCWIFTGRTDAEAETPILWSLDAKNWLIGKDPDAGKDWRWEEKGMTGWDDWMASSTRWTWVWASSVNWWWDREAWRAAVYGVAKSQTWLTTELTELI